MKKTLILYNPEYADLAIKPRDNHHAHDHGAADIVSVEEHDDIEYAEKMQYDEAVFIAIILTTTSLLLKNMSSFRRKYGGNHLGGEVF